MNKNVSSTANLSWQIIFLLSILMLAVFYLTGVGPYLNTNGDNAHYIILAKSIATGQGFRSINLPDKPAHTTYGFVFPLFLSPFVFLWPDNYFVLKIVPLIFAVAGTIIVYYLLRDRIGYRMALILALMSGTSPAVFNYSHITMSETCYLFFSLLFLYLLEKILPGISMGLKKNRPDEKTMFANAETYKKGDYDRKDIYFWIKTVIAGLVLALAYLTKSIGLSLAISVFIYLLIALFVKNRPFLKNKRPENHLSRKDNALLIKGLLVLIIFVLIISPWQIRNMFMAHKETASVSAAYWQQLLMSNPYVPESGCLTILSLMSRVKINILTYLYLLPEIMFPLPLAGLLKLGLGLIILFFISAGIISFMRRKISILEIYTLLFLLICLVWPWNGERFILPIIPLLYYYLIKGIMAVMSDSFFQILKRQTALLALILIIPAIITSNIIADTKTAQKETGPLYYPDEWKNYYYLALWTKGNIPSDAIIMCRKPFLFHLWSRHQTLTFLLSDEDKIMVQISKYKVSYVVVDAFTWSRTTEYYLIPALSKYRSMFEVIYVSPEPRTYLLRVKHPR